MFEASKAKAAPNTPTLMITNQPLPENLRQQSYAGPRRAPEVTPQQILGGTYSSGYDTLVSKKIGGLYQDVGRLQQETSAMSRQLAGMQRDGQVAAAAYYANIGTINTQLQSGTTPGNPRLVDQLSQARGNLERLGQHLADYNAIAVDVAALASEAAYLLESTRSAYSVSGAVEEDHARLADIEDSLTNILVNIDRMQNLVSDDVSRTANYLNAERENLRILSLAVAEGDFYGKSLTSRPFSSAPQTNTVEQVAYSEPSAPPAPNNPKPLVKIKFDRADVKYEQPVYAALDEAMKKYPSASFELVAIEPTGGNAAQAAIESARSRRNAEKVLMTLTQMGLDKNRLDLATAQSSSATTSEVHIYIR
ncbi:MAG: hypothetical protein CL565_01990 [Alphaproteobacteria bacterium]|nr:hypothetical protein [Alphaproteobacteria bacterium]